MISTKTTTVETIRYGKQSVSYSRDLAGNDRLIAVNGADLDQWRADKSLVPPWILDVDLVGGSAAFAAALAHLRD